MTTGVGSGEPAGGSADVAPTAEAARRHARLSEVVLAALARPAAERVAFVEQACADDPALVARAHLLLAQEDRPEGQVALDADASELVGAGRRPGSGRGGTSPGPAAPDTAEAGTSVFDAVAPGYRVVRILGEGGMGTVYEAEQRSPHRRVALKVVRGAEIGGAALRRFAREADVLGQLQHPGICQIHEVGRTTTGAPFLAMELVDGSSLTRHADLVRLGRNEKLALLCRICDAVAHAHERGIVHRDLKPDNILVTRDGRPKIVDFGIARTTGPTLAATLLTTAGAVVGTVAYMSPEQAAGQADIDARTDVFALGVMGFELLTGTRPAKVDGLTLSQALHVISLGDHAAALRRHPELRGDVETILAKALEREPGRRYADAGELAADIRRHLLHEPIVARPPSLGYRVGKFTRRHRTLVSATAVAFLALGVGTGLALEQAHVANVQRGLASERALEAERQAYRFTVAAVVREVEAGLERDAVRDLATLPAAEQDWITRHLAVVLDEAFGRTLWTSPSVGAAISADGDSAFTTSLEDGGELLRFALPAGGLAQRYPLAARPLVVPREAVALAIEAEIHLHPEGAGFDIVDADGEALLRHVTTPPWDPERRPRIGSHAGLLPVAVSRSADVAVFGQGGAAWDLVAGRPAAGTLEGLQVVPSPDGTLLFGAGNSWATLLDTATGEVRWRSPPGTDGFSSVAFASDGRSMYTAGLISDRSLRRWSLPEGVLLAERLLDGCSGSESWAISADGVALAIAPSRERIDVLDADLHASRARRPLPASGRVDLALGPGGTRLLAATDTAGLRFWDLASPSARAVLAGHTRYVYAVAFSPDGRRFASGGWTGTVRLWDVAGQRLVATFAGATRGTIEAIEWSPDGRALLVGAGNEVRILDAESGRTTAVRDFGIRVLDIALRPSAPELLVTTSAGLRLLDRETLQDLREGPSGSGGSWSPDGRRLATTGDDGSLVLRDAESLAEECRSSPEAFGFRRPAWSPDGRRVAARVNGQILILDGDDGRTLARADAVDPMCHAWSPDGKLILVGRSNGSLGVLDGRTGDPVVTLTGHRAYVKSLAFSPDGSTLASGSGDGDVRLWLAAAPAAEGAGGTGSDAPR